MDSSVSTSAVVENWRSGVIDFIVPVIALVVKVTLVAQTAVRTPFEIWAVSSGI